MSNRRPLISVLHPTRRVALSEAFPSGWRAAHDAYLAACDNPEHVEYVLVIHESRWDEAMASDLLADRPEGFGAFTVVRNNGRDSAVDQINCGAQESTGLLLTGAHDDLFPPEHWDTLVLKAVCLRSLPRPELASRAFELEDSDWPGVLAQGLESELVIRCSSGSPRDNELTIAGFMSRPRYERMGYCLSPEFSSGIFADNYFDFELRRDEKAGLVTVIERPDIQFEHRHPIFGKGTVDESYAQQNADANYKQGVATFAKLTAGTRVLSLCLPGETFSHDAHISQMRLAVHVHIGPRFIPQVHSGHCTDPAAVRIEFTKQILSGVPKADLVYWQDDDNVVSTDQFDRLVLDLDTHPELDGVVGWCWCDPGNTPGKALMPSCGRQHGWKGRVKDGLGFGCDVFMAEDLARAKAHGGLIFSEDLYPDAFWSGFPCVLMRASVLERLGWQAFVPLVREDLDRGYSSEDFAFFYHAHLAGLQFAVDLDVCVPHLKVRPVGPLYGPDMQQAELEVMPLKNAAD